MLFERTPGGPLYREVYLDGTRVATKKSLRHSDKERAHADGYKLLVALKARRHALSGSTLTLRMLFDNYRGSPAHQAKKPRSRDEDERRLARVVAFLGGDRDIRSLSDSDVERYRQTRMGGEHPVRARTVAADLVTLQTALNWATRQRGPRGQPVLECNPLRGVKLPVEKNPRRPVATWDRFQATRMAMQQLTAAATAERERMRWIKLELALVLAEATGRRLSSIRQLRWDDVDLERHTIRWRADADKRGRESVVPIPQPLCDELKQFQRQLGAVGGWLFPGERKPDQPMDRHQFDNWLGVAEKKAGLPKLEGGLWHPLRRKWATERKHLPIKDVAAAGGWKDTATLLSCYQHPDEDTMLAVMSEPRKVRDRAAS
jgi:integrase